MHPDIERILLGEEEIRSGIEHLAQQIAADHGDQELTVVAVLKGSCIFVADLVRRLPLALQLAFVWAESYRQGTRAGNLELFGLPGAEEIAGRSVLLVDDILDSGRTLARVRSELLRRGAGAVRICVLLDKPERRELPIEPDYCCFRIADVFVVGYGLDHAGRHRNLPYLAALKPQLSSTPSDGEEGAG